MTKATASNPACKTLILPAVAVRIWQFPRGVGFLGFFTKFLLLVNGLFFVGCIAHSTPNSLSSLLVSDTHSIQFQVEDRHSRVFDRMTISWLPRQNGYVVDCIIQVSNELVGIQTLTTDTNTYTFDLVIGDYTVKGTLQVQFAPSDKVSSLRGDFQYGSTTSSLLFYFKGTVGWWHTWVSPPPIPALSPPDFP